MPLSIYHQKFTQKPDADIQKRLDEKENELLQIFAQVKFNNTNETIRIAVLGCADKRLAQGHRVIFKKILNKKIELTTFDLTTEHLLGEENIIKHDCTLPLPNAPFDITYAHVLLKFIPTEKQFDLIKNSYNSLTAGGIAIHVLDKVDYETSDQILPDGCFSVPLDRYKAELTKLNITFLEIPVKYGLSLILSKR